MLYNNRLGDRLFLPFLLSLLFPRAQKREGGLSLGRKKVQWSRVYTNKYRTVSKTVGQKFHYFQSFERYFFVEPMNRWLTHSSPWALIGRLLLQEDRLMNNSNRGMLFQHWKG